eukprot:g13372.t1
MQMPNLGETGTSGVTSNNVDDYDDFNLFLETVLSDAEEPPSKPALQDEAAVGPDSGADTKLDELREECQEASTTGGVGRAAEGDDVAGVPLNAADVDTASTTDNSSGDDNDDGDGSLLEKDSFTELGAPTVPFPSASFVAGDQQSIASTLTSEGSQSPQLALLLPFVPRLVLQMYDADAPQMPTGPMHMLLDAAVGLFDVSGFSKIADRLEKEEADGGSTSAVESEGVALRRKGSMMLEQGASLRRKGSMMPEQNRGVDRLGNKKLSSRHNSVAAGLSLNDSGAGLLTDTVEMHGGDILKFAGDAIIVCWSPTRELGVELLNSRDPVMSSLGLHIGLGASKVLAGHVGGVENRWEFFITGEACEEMNRSEKDANNMEIVFSGAVGDWIRRYKALNGGTVELATVRLASGNERLVFLECMYIPQPVKINLKDGVVETAGGIRKITVVFMELLDVEIAVSDDKDTLDQAWFLYVNRTVRKIQEAVCHYDATLRQFIVDDKGTVAIVVFGLPPIFHEDNAARGINLGLRLLRQGVQAKIGVTTGSAFAGVIGAACRQEYAAVGDAVNMSARLMGKAARNTVLCDASTAKEAEDAFTFKEAMRIKVKGKEEPIAVFEPLGAGAVLRTKAANNFLDRGDHADYLQASVGKEPASCSALPGSSREIMSNAHVPVGTKTVLIEGERGSGKSILLSKVLCQLLGLDQDHLNWYGAANRTATAAIGPSPAAAAAAAAAAGTAASSEATAAAAAAVDVAASAAGVAETGGDVAPSFRRGSTRRRSSIVAVGLGMLGGGGRPGEAGGTEGGEAGDAAAEPGSNGGPALQGLPAPVPPVRKRSSWVSVANFPGRRRSIEPPSAVHPYEPTAARGHLVQNPGFMALMKDPELSKHLPLLNMILPLYNEQAVGAVMSGVQDTHSKLRRLADMIAALLVHRLEISKKGSATPGGDRKDVAVTAVPSSATSSGSNANAPKSVRRGSLVLRMALIGDVGRKPSSLLPPVDKSRGCGAAIVLDNAQWLDHNSWELLHLLRKALPGVLIFAASRPFSEMNLKHNIALKTAPGTLKMNMGRLTATQVMLILEDSFGVQRTSEELLEFLEVTAKGNPRDVIHMMEDLFKQGIVEVNLGAVVILKELSENSLKIQDHTSAPVIAKYDQLTRGTQQLVQAAAVIGEEVPLDLLVDVHSLLAPTIESGRKTASSTSFTSRRNMNDADDTAMAVAPTEAGGATGGGKRAGADGDDVDAQINTLVRVGLLERSSLESVRFVAKYMATVIYDMILHSKRQEMHKEIIMWYLTQKSFVDLRPHFRFLGKHAMAAGDHDLAVNFLVMAAEVAISCGDPTEAQLACAAVTQAVDDSGASGHLTLLDQVLRETKFHLLVGQTAILSQDWESAEMSLQLAVDMSG